MVMTQPTHLDLDALQALAGKVYNWPEDELDSDEYCDAIEALEDAMTARVVLAIIDRLRKAEAAREGWKLVPRVPNADMVSVFMRHMMNEPEGDGVEQVVEGLALMIAAAPDSTPTDSAEVKS
jgi:hypothetical protein